MDADISPSTAEYKKQLHAFLQTEKYAGMLTTMKDKLSPRLIVNMNELRQYDASVATAVMEKPIEMTLIFEATLKESLMDLDPKFFDRVAASRQLFLGPNGDKTARAHVGFEGNFGEGTVTPRTLSASHLATMVAVQGIVTRCSIVRPKVVRSVHYCEDTQQFEAREYRDATDFSGLPTGSVYPTKDKDGKLLVTEFGLSVYHDSQTITIQEMPESAPLGQLPRSVDVSLDNDLVDLVKPGDRVSVFGIYRALAGTSAGATTNGSFKTMLLCNNIRRLGKDIANIVLTARDVEHCKEFAKDEHCFDILARSLAPSIYGHKTVKQSLALLLTGGVEHNLENGTHIRGDINLLMVGDPSTAKSQLLRFVLNIAPVAVNTTGRGSSGVGLTAAVTTDPETGERRLEAGAMVLADRGVVCIDEFDKMSDADRVAIHEVMEQQTVTIAKAGIQASLNARCSVVAAANPVYGRFDPSLALSRNVALPDSLLSRFDLLFIIRDIVSKDSDLRLAEHVLRMHRYVKPGQEGVPVRLGATLATESHFDEDEAADGTTPVYIKFNPVLHGAIKAETKETTPRLLNLDFIRKFIHHVKDTRPKLTDKSRGAIVLAYNDFRQRTSGRATLITARSLETIVRLSSAHAKLRLSTTVKISDVRVAVDIMNYALYGDSGLLEAPVAVQESAQPVTPPRPGGGEGGAGGRPDSDDEDGGDALRRPGAGRRAGPKAGKKAEEGQAAEEEERAQLGQKRSAAQSGAGAKKARGESSVLAEAVSESAEAGEEEEEEEEGGVDSAAAYEAFRGPAAADAASLRAFKEVLTKHFKGDGDGAVTIAQLPEVLMAGLGARYAADVGRQAWLFSHLKALEEEDKVLVADGIIHFV